ncbi:MAG: hypothetical protein K2X39_04845 [Silvanigrellaceae bacterium]|nr:hypothetical protein [Silvanigrellaceae bacterium]
MSSALLTNMDINNNVKEALQRRLWLDILPDSSFYLLSSPLLILLLGSVLALIFGVFKTDPNKPSYAAWYISLFACFASSLCTLLNNYSTVKSFLGSGVLIDKITFLSFLVVSIGTLYTLLAASLTEIGKSLLRSEILSLILLCSSGLMIMSCSGEFMSFFIGLEIASVSLYVIVGYQRKSYQALEGAMKYFLLGACAAAIMLMGAALIYLQIGTLRWSDFSLLNLSYSSPLALIGVVLLFSGLAFKLAIAPFHVWAADVYQGSHSHMTGYMASIVKLAEQVTKPTMRSLNCMY